MDAASPADGLWDDGWYRHAARRSSPNRGPRPLGTSVSLIVLHSISLPPGDYTGDAIERLFTNALDWGEHPYYDTIRGLQVSAHFLVRRDGRLLQFVCGDERAWHAGTSTFNGRVDCNDYSVGIELEGIEGGLFEHLQYETLAALMAALADRYPITHVAGHEHVAPGRKRDPGSGFDWAELQRWLAWPDRCFPESHTHAAPASATPRTPPSA